MVARRALPVAAAKAHDENMPCRVDPGHGCEGPTVWNLHEHPRVVSDSFSVSAVPCCCKSQAAQSRDGLQGKDSELWNIRPGFCHSGHGNNTGSQVTVQCAAICRKNFRIICSGCTAGRPDTGRITRSFQDTRLWVFVPYALAPFCVLREGLQSVTSAKCSSFSACSDF